MKLKIRHNLICNLMVISSILIIILLVLFSTPLIGIYVHGDVHRASLNGFLFMAYLPWGYLLFPSLILVMVMTYLLPKKQPKLTNYWALFMLPVVVVGIMISVSIIVSDQIVTYPNFTQNFSSIFITPSGIATIVLGFILALIALLTFVFLVIPSSKTIPASGEIEQTQTKMPAESRKIKRLSLIIPAINIAILIIIVVLLFQPFVTYTYFMLGDWTVTVTGYDVLTTGLYPAHAPHMPWSWLRSIFSTPVYLFVFPTLLLLFIISLGMIIFKKNRDLITKTLPLNALMVLGIMILLPNYFAFRQVFVPITTIQSYLSVQGIFLMILLGLLVVSTISLYVINKFLIKDTLTNNEAVAPTDNVVANK